MISVLTPLEFLARSASVYRDYTAVVDEERRLSYADLQSRVHQLASALAHEGINPGDRVAVLCRNRLLALECHFAVPLGRSRAGDAEHAPASARTRHDPQS